MAMNNTILSNAMKPELEKDLNDLFAEMEQRATTPQNAEDRNPMEQPEFVDRMSKIIADVVAEKVVEHIQSFAEVRVNEITGLVETFAAGVGKNNGSLTSVSGGPVSGSVRLGSTSTGTGTIS